MDRKKDDVCDSWLLQLYSGIYPYLPMATNAPRSIFFWGGGSIKSLILSFNIQQYEFCAQIY